jgi:hypothetical protein
MSLKIRLKIDGTERQANLLEQEWSFETNAHGKLDHAIFILDDPTNAITVTRGVECLIEDFNDALDRRFGGIVTEVLYKTKGLGRTLRCKALSWIFLTDKALVNEKYRGKSDQFIISDATDGIFAKSETNLLGYGFTVTSAKVLVGNANTQFLQFKRNTIRDILDTLKDMAAKWVWYVDPFKVLVYEPIGATSHSFHLSDSPDDSASFPYFGLDQVFSITKLVNSVTVEGSFLRELFADLDLDDTDRDADGIKTLFNVGALWQASAGNTKIRVYKNDGADAAPAWGAETELTVGIAGSTDTLSTFDTLWDPAARALEFATAPPNLEHSFRIQGDRLRALIHQEDDAASILLLGLKYGHSIKDVTLVSDEHVVLRAKAELDDLSDEAERLTCRTQKDGVVAGKNLGMVNTILGIGSTGSPVDYLVEKVTTHLLGGTVAEYTLQLRAV